MYRSSGSVSVLSGVLSGPYSGGKKTLEAGLLEDATRARLERALSGRGAPEPIAYERPGGQGWLSPTWGVILAIGLICALFATGWGNLDSRFAEQPGYFAVFYVALGLLFTGCFVALLRRRATYGTGALRPGCYLFPLDTVDISAPDASGRQTLVVRPLGDARDAAIETNGKTTELVIRFEGGDLVRWPLRGDANGEIALKRLGYAQKLLEELSYSPVLDHAFTSDLFFEVRADKSWDKLEPTGASAPIKLPTWKSIVLGRFAPVLAVVTGLAFGSGVYAFRYKAGDAQLFATAYFMYSPDAMERYLALGGHDTGTANEVLQGFKDRAAEAAKRQAQEVENDRAAAAMPSPTNDEKCINALADSASTKHPKTTQLLIQNIKNTRMRVHGRQLWLSFKYHGDPSPTLAEDEATFTRALVRVLSDVCPTMQVITTNAGEILAYWGAHLEVDYTVKPRAQTWPDGSHAADFAFDVHLFSDRSIEPVDGFTLTLPPPNEAPTKLRDRSIVGWGVPDGPHANTNEYAQDARAFDRLYDEVWSLFFDGDPVVPLSSPRAVLTP